MTYTKRKPGVGAHGPSDHASTGGISSQYKLPKLDNQRIATIRKNETEAVSVDLIDFAGFQYVQITERAWRRTRFTSRTDVILSLEQLEELQAAIGYVLAKAKLAEVRQ